MSKIADKLDALADRLQKDIDHARRPMTQNPTPKRMREYNSRLHDANNWERAQYAMRALAVAHRAGTVPPILAKLATKADILPLVHKGILCGGYYEVIPDPEYRDKSDAGLVLQAMIDNKTPEMAAVCAERDRQEKIGRMIDELRFCAIPGFFPTPACIVGTMLDRAEIEPGMIVLEPSAGIGSIADAIRQRVARMPAGPGVLILCCEIVPRLREILKAKGHVLTDVSDFLELPEAGEYDRIVMNPPFERTQDIDHVLHAYGCLKPGGRLVAIMSAGSFSNGRRKGEEFREWLDGLDSQVAPLPQDAFNGPGSFRQTGVSARLVVIDKAAVVEPMAEPEPTPTPSMQFEVTGVTAELVQLSLFS
jgi:protein-L-isoaspartate O-methyltransferase